MTGEPSFTCPRCGMTSHHPVDAEEGYCGNCHDWTGGGPPPPASAADVITRVARHM